MIRPEDDTVVLVAFCSREDRRAKRPRGIDSSGLETDGTVLWDCFGRIAEWTDETRVSLNEDRANDGATILALEAFLTYWRKFYVVGVSRRSFSSEVRS